MGHARYFIVFFFAFLVVALLAPARARVAPAPLLLTKAGSTRGVAVESVTRVEEPFTPDAILPLGSDNRTRVMLFANNLSLLSTETAADVTASAEDGNHLHYPLTVEHVGDVAGASGVTSVIVRLNDNLGDAGDVLVGITFRGATSNRVRIAIGHIGGGPPDDEVIPQPTPELGLGASLHGKQLFPSDNAWNEDISNAPVDPNSANLIAGIGLNTGLHPDFGTVGTVPPTEFPTSSSREIKRRFRSTSLRSVRRAIPVRIRFPRMRRSKVDQTAPATVTCS